MGVYVPFWSSFICAFLFFAIFLSSNTVHVMVQVGISILLPQTLHNIFLGKTKNDKIQMLDIVVVWFKKLNRILKS